MLSYVIKRLLLAIPTLVLASFLVFAVLRLIPGDPAMMVVGGKCRVYWPCKVIKPS